MLTIEDHDFTIHKFLQLCKAISSNYATVTMTEYICKQHPDKFILLRHDVDRMPERTLETAKIEYELGIKATYYFRTNKSVFKPDIIHQIRDMGHEIGYHYETLSEAKGDKKKAFNLFKANLDDFRNVCDVKTICMHGKPLSKYDNRELWEEHDFKELGLIGEAYLSVGDDLNYLSDTGRTWGSGNNLRDYIPGKTERIFAHTTDDLIRIIKSNQFNNFYILAHPERWSSSILGWSLLCLWIQFFSIQECKRVF